MKTFVVSSLLLLGSLSLASKDDLLIRQSVVSGNQLNQCLIYPGYVVKRVDTINQDGSLVKRSQLLRGRRVIQFTGSENENIEQAKNGPFAQQKDAAKDADLSTVVAYTGYETGGKIESVILWQDGSPTIENKSLSAKALLMVVSLECKD